MNPELHSLAKLDWQLFVTLTFKQEKLPEHVRRSMFFAWLRSGADFFRVHFKKMVWVLRLEAGERTGRLHYHAVIAGLPPSAVQTATCFALMRTWKHKGGGHARITVYNPSLDGLDYLTKGIEERASLLAARYAGDYYELTKFGGSCDVTLSESCIAILQSRRTYRKDTLSTTTQSGAIPLGGTGHWSGDNRLYQR